MINKNTFGFTLAAAATLGLGFMVYGCGDSGSTVPNPLGKDSAKVIFNYNVLSQGLAAKTDIPANIASVKYAFSGTNDAKEAFTNLNEAYTYDFEHKDKAYDQEVIIKDVDTNSTKVTAAYYDEKEQLVAIGINDLEWDKTTDIAIVKKPDVQFVDENSTATLSADSLIIPKNGQVYFTFEITPQEGTDPVEVTDLAVFSGLDDKVFSHAENAAGGVYTGIDYGKATEVSASLGQFKADLGQTVLVTDQTPAKVALVPQPIDGKEIINQKTPDGGRMNMLFADDGVEYNTFGQKVVTVDQDNFPVNEAPFKVLVTEYTNIEGKGEAPELPLDITFDSKTSVEAIYDPENDASPSAYDVNRMAIKDRSKIVVEGLNSGWNNYKVVAKYDDGSQDGVTETTNIYVEGAKANLVFWDEKKNQKLEEIFLTFNEEYVGQMALQLWNPLHLVGQIEVFGNCVYTDIPEDMIPAGQYPDVVTPPHFSETGKEVGVEYVNEWRQWPEHSGANYYVLVIQYKCGTPWPGDVKLELQRPEGATYPYFGGVYVDKLPVLEEKSEN